MTYQILFRYLFRKAITTTLIVFSSLGGLLLIFGIADESSRRVGGEYSALNALEYKLLTLPYELYELAPLLIALSALITFSTLNKNSELIIIKQVSKSEPKLVIKLFIPLILICIPLFWIGEWLAPKWSNNATAERASLRGRTPSSQDQQWFRSGNWIISAAFVNQSDGSLISPTIYEFNNNELKSITEAELASALNNQWELINVTKRNLLRNNRGSLTESRNLIFGTATLTPKIAIQLGSNSDTLTLSQLTQRLRYAQIEGNIRISDAITWWQRLLFPLEILLMLHLALIFSLTSFRQKTVGDVVFKGLAMALGLTTFLDVVSGILAVSGLPIILSAILPLLLSLGATQYISHKKL